MSCRYAELHCVSNFTFLRGASHPSELIYEACRLGYSALALTDECSMAGVVRAHDAAKERNFKLIVGAEFRTTDGFHVVLLAPSQQAYAQICTLITLARRDAPKGQYQLTRSQFESGLSECLALWVPGADPTASQAAWLQRFFSGRAWIAVELHRGANDAKRLDSLRQLGQRTGLPLVASGDVHMHVRQLRALQDTVTAIRHGCTLAHAGHKLFPNGERHLREIAELETLYPVELLEESARIAERCTFSLSSLQYRYPNELVPRGLTASEHLRNLVEAGVRYRWPNGCSERVRGMIEKELALISELEYEHFFLTVHDIVEKARELAILCQGRGSAANSVVCYALRITEVSPDLINTLFERFLSKERNEPPDIDVDFEHERREEVIQYIYERYGRHRAALAATVIHYKPRSAIREVGKVFGLSEDISAALAGTVWGSWGSGLDEVHVRQAGLDPQNPYLKRAVAIASELVGFPRHLSQHVGGFVLTQDRLDEIVPVGPAAMPDRSFIEWDKDDIDALKIMKVDVLALGMLTCIRKAFDLIRAHDGEDLSLASVPKQDDEVYAMLSRADSLGVFQVESRAQMNMLPRLRPRKFYDLVIEVAIVRPGPIQGDMVHPYLAQRAKDPASIVYPGPAPEHGEKDELKKVLEKTLGVPLFQEQAMRIAMVAAKFSGEEANALRRSMATFRNRGGVDVFRDKMVGRMIARGYDPEFANRCFKQIEGFGSYGFPESHAASFAKLVYVSSWLKCRHPAAFACALLNAQPMGFYAPAEIVRDAREHGVEVRGADIAVSFWDNTLERRPDGALRIRLGFRQIEGFRQEWAKALVAARSGFFTSIEELRRRTRLPKAALVKLADADAFRSMKLDRRAALWEVRRLPDDVALPLFEAADAADHASEATAPLPAMPLTEHVVADYQTTRLSLKGHPMQFLRTLFSGESAVSCAEVRAARDGRRLKAAGVVLVRQKPGSAKGVVFMTIADETGVANAVIWPTIMARFRKEVMGSRLVLIEGRVQRSPEGVVHLVAESLVDRSREFGRLSERELKPQLSNADEFLHPQMERGARPRIHPRDVRIMPKSRDFH